MTTCIRDYLNLSNEEMVTMLLMSDREEDIIQHLSDLAVTRVDQATQRFCDQWVDKHDTKPPYEDWLRVRVQCLREQLEAAECEGEKES